jgi:hypothetical protein
MEYTKNISGSWAKGAELTNGVKAKLIEEVQRIESQFLDDKGNKKTQDVGKVRFEGKQEILNVSFNRATIYGLIDAFGKESKDWVGKVLTVHTEKVTVAGKRQTALYLIPEGFEIGEDLAGYVVVRRINSEEKAEPEEVIDVEGTPF